MAIPKEVSKQHLDIVRRLDVIIGLLLDLVNKKEIKTEGSQIYRLKQLGLDLDGIASVIGKTKDKISKQIYKLKSKK